MLIKLNERKIS